MSEIFVCPDACNGCRRNDELDYMRSKIDKLNRKVAELEQAKEKLQYIIDDYRDGADRILSEKCPTDERHCGCVPVLRKQLSNYQNTLVLITTFPSSKQQTWAENQMQKFANDALDYNASQKIDAAKYWVGKVDYLQGELKITVDRLAECLKQNDLLFKKNEWIPIEERLPGEYEIVLVCHKDEPDTVRVYQRMCDRWCDPNLDYWKDHDEFTHWRPLPPPPECEGK